MNEPLITAQVQSVTPLTDSILQIILKPNRYVEYLPGQYLQIMLGDLAYSYSIANAPLGSHTYELHIRHTPDNSYNQALLAEIKKQGALKLQLPLGECHVQRLAPNLPVIFVAAGTGFAPIKAMIEHLLASGDARAFELYWGARSQSDLYMDEKVHHWQKHVQHFQFFSLLSTSSKETLAEKIVKQHRTDLNHWQVVMAGPFDMAFNTRDALTASGALAKNLFSDAFSFESE